MENDSHIWIAHVTIKLCKLEIAYEYKLIEHNYRRSQILLFLVNDGKTELKYSFQYKILAINIRYLPT